MRTIEQFHTFDSTLEIILVLPEGHHALWEKLCTEYSFTITHQVVIHAALQQRALFVGQRMSGEGDDRQWGAATGVLPVPDGFRGFLFFIFLHPFR